MISVELRKQLSGFESSLLTCNRQAAVKIRTRITNLKSILADCVADGVSARKIYSEENFLIMQENDGGKVADEKNKKIIENRKNGENSENHGNSVSKEDSTLEVDVEVDMSIVDRGSELLENILSNGRPAGTVEETWERIILAEKMRFRLDAMCGPREDRKEKEKENEGVSRDSDRSNRERERERERLTGGVASDVTGSSDSVTVNNADSCTSKKYVTYVNQNFNSVKRIAAVVKV